MTTNRSRNKLERKAHMNIHNTIEVTDDNSQFKELAFTRDRFGKKQKVTHSEENE